MNISSSKQMDLSLLRNLHSSSLTKPSQAKLIVNLRTHNSKFVYPTKSCFHKDQTSNENIFAGNDQYELFI